MKNGYSKTQFTTEVRRFLTPLCAILASQFAKSAAKLTSTTNLDKLHKWHYCQSVKLPYL